MANAIQRAIKIAKAKKAVRDVEGNFQRVQTEFEKDPTPSNAKGLMDAADECAQKERELRDAER
jgi:hypothetical protein